MMETGRESYPMPCLLAASGSGFIIRPASGVLEAFRRVGPISSHALYVIVRFMMDEPRVTASGYSMVMKENTTGLWCMLSLESEQQWTQSYCLRIGCDTTLTMCLASGDRDERKPMSDDRDARDGLSVVPTCTAPGPFLARGKRVVGASNRQLSGLLT